jgi:hypothetical protein
MSLTPEPASTPPTTEDSPSGAHSTRTPRLLRLCFAIFTFEIGLFLTVFPWVDIWSLNYFSAWIPPLANVWDDPYFRGAITGLGLVNIYVACAEVLRIFRRTS